MAYQFGHINAYSQTGSINSSNPKITTGCLGEAFRDEGMASHVNDPKKPIILLGSREEINSALKNYEDKFKDSRGHKLRKDGKELLAGVLSWLLGTASNQYNMYLPLIIFYLMKKYGSSLRCILSHEDEPFFDETGKYHGETHFHIHFFVVPKSTENFRDYHPGLMAKWQAKEDGLNHWEADDRYKWRMGDWQDELNREVGIPLGWLKARPKELQGKRLSRRQYKIIKAAKEESIQIKNEAKIEAKKIIENANTQANSLINNAEKKAEILLNEVKKILIRNIS